MKAATVIPFRTVIPLPAFLLHPLTAVVVAVVHVYLAFGHLSELLGGDIQWTHIWKGFGALGGAYIFAALASRALVRREGRLGSISMKNEWKVIFPFENK
jgi:hypothetical protein